MLVHDVTLLPTQADEANRIFCIPYLITFQPSMRTNPAKRRFFPTMP